MKSIGKILSELGIELSDLSDCSKCHDPDCCEAGKRSWASGPCENWTPAESWDDPRVQECIGEMQKAYILPDNERCEPWPSTGRREGMSVEAAVAEMQRTMVHHVDGGPTVAGTVTLAHVERNTEPLRCSCPTCGGEKP